MAQPPDRDERNRIKQDLKNAERAATTAAVRLERDALHAALSQVPVRVAFDEALAIAQRNIPPADSSLGLRVDATVAVETKRGWFFPFRADKECGGSNGLIVHKQTGKVFRLGSAYAPEDDIVLYDLGYQFAEADLVILTVRDLDTTVARLIELGIRVAEPEYENGVVWRVGRTLTNTELRVGLSRLPCVFGPLGIYFLRDTLEEMRKSDAFTFKLIEFVAAAR